MKKVAHDRRWFGYRRVHVLLKVEGLAVMLAVALAARDRADSATNSTSQGAVRVANPVHHFEIPVTDMDRAVHFYQSVFGYELSRQTIDDYEMAFFPRSDGTPGACGALARGDVYVPSKSGAVINFDAPDIDPVLERALAQGATILYSRKHVGASGYVAEISDSEDNRIALNVISD